MKSISILLMQGSKKHIAFDPFSIELMSPKKVEKLLATTTSLLFDDDCGVCTDFARLFHKIRPQYLIFPMHCEPVEQIGLQELGQPYWTSFHIVKNGSWSTEFDAIRNLVQLFPLGDYLKIFLRFPAFKWFSITTLRFLQIRRKMACVVS